jgi:PAS domain S-box-containing protein
MNKKHAGKVNRRKADARVLGQILAAQNIEFVLPDIPRIAEFYTETLMAIPGIAACRICLEDVTIQRGEIEIAVCDECRARQGNAAKHREFSTSREYFECRLANQPEIQLNSITTLQHHFGFFIFRVGDPDVFEIYKPFIGNLANYVAFSLENRLQKDWLQKARDELECRVEERTRDLAATNVHLQKEIENRQQVEEALQESERQIRQLIDSSPVAMVVSVGVDEQVEWVNGKFIELFGYTLEDMPNAEYWWPLAYPDNAYREMIKTQWRERVEQAIREKSQIEPMEATVRCKDGTQRYVEFRLSSVGPKHLITFVDLTEHKRVEDALRESEERYHTLFEHAPDAILLESDEDEIVDVNPAACALLGYSREELLSLRVIDLQAPEIRGPVGNIVKGELSQYGGSLFESVDLRRDGTRVAVEISTSRMGDSNLALSIVRDITERKQSEIALQRLNRELRAISNCNQTLLRADDEQNLLNEICRIVCEEAGYHMAWVGYAEDDDARTVRPVAWAGNEAGYLANAQITWADTERGRGPTGTAIRSGRSATIQDFSNDLYIALWRQDALQRGYRSNIALPLKDDQGNAFGALTIYSTEPNAFTPSEIRLLEELSGDLAFGITVLRARAERKQAEVVLRISDARYRMAQAMGHVGSWEYNLQTTHFWGSDEAKRIYGFDPSQPDFSTDDVESCIPERERVHQALVDLIEAGKPYDLEFEIIPRNASEPKIIASLAQLQRDEHGQPLKVVGVIQDITARKRAEAEIRSLNQELEKRVADRTADLVAANKELEAFAYSVSHDLRAPLRHIGGFLEILKQSASATMDEQSLHYMEIISNSAKRMSVMIDDLLSFSRMSRSEMSKAQVDLGKLVQDVIQEFELETANREIEWQVSPLPEIIGDRAMLRLVLENLISNALKFTRSRTPAKIEVGWMPGPDAEKIIFIRDNGVGFDMQYADKLFGVFQRLHRAEQFEGTGIGLANVRRIIERHGGKTWAEAQPGQGATFYFSFPAAPD